MRVENPDMWRFLTFIVGTAIKLIGGYDVKEPKKKKNINLKPILDNG